MHQQVWIPAFAGMTDRHNDVITGLEPVIQSMARKPGHYRVFFAQGYG